MKNLMLNFAIATGFAALIASTPAIAQGIHRAAIPFSFAAGGTQYPSGDYEISRVGLNSLLRLTRRRGNCDHGTRIPNSSKNNEAARVVAAAIK